MDIVVDLITKPKRRVIRRQAISYSLYRFVAVALIMLSLTACSTLTSTPEVRADAQASWALLPIENLSENAQADSQAQIFVETQLRTRGVQQLDIYAPLNRVSLRGLLDSKSQLAEAADWAKARGYRYGLTGTVHEWQYKGGADKEPAIGVSLKLLDLSRNEVLWQGTAARTGWGYANLPAVANKVIADLLQQIRLDLNAR